MEGVILVEKKVDVKEKYSQELNYIECILEKLEEGRYYENSHVQMDGYLSTNLQKLRDNINDLINKIEYNGDSINEEMAKAINKLGDILKC